MAFRQRVQSCLDDLLNYDSGESVFAFTSATPIAMLTGLALDLTDEKILHLMGILYNTSLTTMRVRQRELSLFTLNTIPHLDHQTLYTFR